MTVELSGADARSAATASAARVIMGQAPERVIGPHGTSPALRLNKGLRSFLSGNVNLPFVASPVAAPGVLVLRAPKALVQLDEGGRRDGSLHLQILAPVEGLRPDVVARGRGPARLAGAARDGKRRLSVDLVGIARAGEHLRARPLVLGNPGGIVAGGTLRGRVDREGVVLPWRFRGRLAEVDDGEAPVIGRNGDVGDVDVLEIDGDKVERARGSGGVR